jgi:integrase
VSSWYGQWRANGRRLKRCIGPKRLPGSREGLTRQQAEARLRQLVAETPAARPTSECLTLAERHRYMANLRAKGRKPSTIVAAESCLKVWLLPALGDRSLDAIKSEHVEDLMSRMEVGDRPGRPGSKPCGPKTIRNYVGTLSAIYHFAMHSRRRWAPANPCDDVDLPELEGTEDIHFLEPSRSRRSPRRPSRAPTTRSTGRSTSPRR